MKLKKHLDEAKEVTMPTKDILTVLQALWKAETFMNQVLKGNTKMLDVKHWLSVIKDAQKILERIR